METQELIVRPKPGELSLTLRDIAVVGFHHRQAVVLCFFGVLLGTILWATIWPRYKAETEILLRRERVDPVVTAQQTNPLMVRDEITEEELNSEVELISSEDVLRNVVVACKLDKSGTNWLGKARDPEQQIAIAVRQLRGSLNIEAIPKTNVIRVTYTSRQKTLAAAVLNALDAAYLEKHKELHHTNGQFAFFDQQTINAKQALDDAENRLKAFPTQTSVPNPALARDIALQKVNEFNASLGQTRAAIAEAQQRIATMEQLSQSTPSRLTTQMKDADDAPVLQQMKSALITLQLKRSEMASKYQPNYPPLQELDREIAQTQAAIAGEKPLKDVTTDQNPSYVWLNSEIVKTKSELKGYEAKAAETETIIRQNLDGVRRLDEAGVEQQQLLRTAKTAEENYLLYLRKREEARINDALDQAQLLNVEIAEKASIPSFSTQSTWSLSLVGFVLAIAVSGGIVFTLEYLNPSFRTPREVEAVLNVAVLAAVPDQNRAAAVLPNPDNGSSRHYRDSTS